MLSLSCGQWTRYIFCGIALICVVVMFYYFQYIGQFSVSFSKEKLRYYKSKECDYKREMTQDKRQECERQNPTKSKDTQHSLNSESYRKTDEINVLITFTNAKQNFNLQENFKVAISSMLSLATVPVALHIIGDNESKSIARQLIHENHNFRIVNLDTDDIITKLNVNMEGFQEAFTKERSYYHNAIFFLSIAIHKVLPQTVHQVIMLDADVVFHADIKELYMLFSQFSSTNIIGIAREAQPVYRHQFWKYRRENKGTRVGEPPPDGLTGFNSGVLLLDLDKMRNSDLYNSLLSMGVVQSLRAKYSFSGHLGDQCFFTLVSLEHEELFYILPCTWNRQLCQWWKDKGYEDIFDLYFKCEGHINIYHGNCHTKIPSSSQGQAT